MRQLRARAQGSVAAAAVGLFECFVGLLLRPLLPLLELLVHLFERLVDLALGLVELFFGLVLSAAAPGSTGGGDRENCDAGQEAAAASGIVGGHSASSQN